MLCVQLLYNIPTSHSYLQSPFLTVLDSRISKEVLAMYTMIKQSHIRRYPPRLILIEYSPICQLTILGYKIRPAYPDFPHLGHSILLLCNVGSVSKSLVSPACSLFVSVVGKPEGWVQTYLATVNKSFLYTHGAIFSSGLAFTEKLQFRHAYRRTLELLSDL